MLNLAGYEITKKIHESNNSLVCRGLKKADKKSFILKFLKQDYPVEASLVRYKQEYEITRHLNLESVPKAYSLERYENSLVIIFEDSHGESLRLYLDSQKLNLEDFLSIAIKITKALEQIHQHSIIHKDINPSNIIINPATGLVQIIDFGISTVLSRENPSIKNPNILEGTLAYISPEQTGRMNRAIDYHTDFYSLGVTFYELLTGQLPCDYSDAMELVHFHIAKQAIPPYEINSQIPKAVSDIVMKLLAKTAEERYQSAWGIIADLEECLQQLQTKGQIVDFVIAQKDITDKFQIPQKLYGREPEVETLLAAFERVSSGTTEIMLVSGYSGIGKSALVQEIYQPITKTRGYFIAGKFDQFQRNIPYAAVVKAFQSLVKQLLTESETQLNNWKQKLLAAVGANGQIIVDVIPEIELIIGKQPPVQELSATEAQNRFNLVFQKFIRVFCSVDHPLVIFLDDLQWADAATLKLIQVMMADEETKYLFLIGAYRDNEVNPSHPLMVTLDELQKQNARIEQITLAPLHLQQVSHLIADTVHKDRQFAIPLAELVVSKTQGNPFFVNQFLRTLYEENLLNFNFQQRNWDWNISEIEAVGITDNVVDLMIGKLKKMPEVTQQVLRLAACVGNSFDLNTLSIINEKSPGETFKELLPAIQDGLILTTSELGATEAEIINSDLVINTYKFLHDRVQQSGYALIDSKLRTAIHLQIGRLLLANISPERRVERIFEITDHLNSGQELITEDSEKVELALLNLTAARKAKDATAYAAARNYLKIGLDILPGDIWQEFYELAFTFHKELADAEYLNGNFEESEALIELTFFQAKSPIEKAEIYNILIVQYTLLTKYEEAVKAGLKALQLLGIDLAESNLTEAVSAELAEVKANLANQEIASLIHAEKMKDPAKKIALKLLGNMGPLTFFSSQELWKLTVIKAINLSLKYGFVAGGSYCYSCYGIILNSILGDYQSAYEFGRLALTLSENSNNLSQNCQDSVIFANYLNCWVKPIKTTVEINSEGYKVGLQSGNLQWTGYNRMFQTITYFFQGMNLHHLLEDIGKSIHFCHQTKNLWAIDIIMANKLAILDLIGEEEEISEQQHLENFSSRKSMAALCEFYVLKAQTLYLYEQYSEALSASDRASEIIDYLMGHISSAHYHFYRSLILTALYPTVSESQQKDYWQQLETHQKQIKIWADNCRENFAHKYWLVAAEMARISGQDLEAMDLYDRAIASAREHDFIQNQALAAELAAKFWLGKDKEEFFQLYLKKAHYCYQNWGAQRKVAKLEEKYPQLLARTSFPKSTKTKVTPVSVVPDTTMNSLGDTLDLATVMKAAQAISGEIVLSKLLTRLMKIAIENAGAEKGFLILEKAGNWVIEAEGSVKADEASVLRSRPLNATADAQEVPLLASAIANYVIRTQENVVLNNATQEGQFIHDPYVAATQPKSILCTPLLHQGKLTGIFYLENNLTEGAFTTDRLELLKLLSAQIAISLENAQLYKNLQDFNKNLEQLVSDRTQELSHTLDALKATQSQLVEAEKMASLGGLVAGVAHEINTPVGVGVTVASALAEHTTEFASIYKSGKMKRSDLEEFVDIATQSSNSLLINLERAAELIQSFKQVAVDRSSEERRTLQIRAFLDEVLMQLKPKLKNANHSVKIKGDSKMTIDSYPGALSQIITNLLMNSLIHAYEPGISGKLVFDWQQEGDRLRFEYADEGKGIPPENLSKIFEPFFTTKRGQGGSGLGLHIVYNLVTQKLKGEIECQSEVERGTKFIIRLPMQIQSEL